MEKKQIIFIYTGFSTFVKKDYDFFQKQSTVKGYFFKPVKGLFAFILQGIDMELFLLRHIWETDILYCWFAGYHSFLPALFAKLFNKKMVIIVGGNDAVSIPEIKYGVFYKKDLRALAAKWSYKWADLILPVHKSLIEGVNTYADKKGIKTGVKSFVKNIKSTFVELPTGYNSTEWFCYDGEQKQKNALTIANIESKKTYIGKGIDLFLEVAREIPDATFTIIGVHDNMFDYISSKKTENVLLLEYMKNKDDLINHFRRAKTYCQFSLTEGLPNAVCEAMLCECIPVGSNVNGIPDGIGGNGFILTERNVGKAVELVKQAFNANSNLGKKARKHIIKNYPNEKREEALHTLILK